MELNENYVYHAYLSKSFTKAANILYISQPSLSAAIASKEKELGFRIFDRSTKPISLTREGEIYIEMLEGKIRCENDMRLRLKQLNTPVREKIFIGSTIYTSYFLLPTICGAFYRRYPNIEVTLDIGNTHTPTTLCQKLENKELDSSNFKFSFLGTGTKGSSPNSSITAGPPITAHSVFFNSKTAL